MSFKLTVFLAVIFGGSMLYADLKVGVVDEEKIIENYEKSGKLLESLEKQVRQKETDIKQLEEMVKQAEREFMTAGPVRKEEILEQATKSKIEIEVQKRLVKELFNNQRDRYRALVVEDLRVATETIARDQSYDLVLRKEVPGPRGMERTVYFNKDSMDITQAVLDYLNIKFRQENQNKLEK